MDAAASTRSTAARSGAADQLPATRQSVPSATGSSGAAQLPDRLSHRTAGAGCQPHPLSEEWERIAGRQSSRRKYKGGKRTGSSVACCGFHLAAEPPPFATLCTPTPLLLGYLGVRALWSGWPSRGRRIGEAANPGPEVFSADPQGNEVFFFVGDLAPCRDGTGMGVLEHIREEEGSPFLVRCTYTHRIIEIRCERWPTWVRDLRTGSTYLWKGVQVRFDQHGQRTFSIDGIAAGPTAAGVFPIRAEA